MMGSRPDGTYYTQKQPPSEKKKNMNVRTSLSKISLEIVSREEDLEKEVQDTDPLDNFELQDVKIVETVRINDDTSSLLTDELSEDADQFNQPSIKLHPPPEEKAPLHHQMHAELEPIQEEEKYAKSETLQSKDSSQFVYTNQNT